MTAPGPILVVNPNSNEEVTEGMREALAAYALPGGPAIECLTIAEGPFGVETQEDADSVVMPLIRLAKSRPDASAMVIACYSDPGLAGCRSVAGFPVFGIQESGVLTAMARADRFGVIALSPVSILRHRPYMRRMGVLERLAATRPLNMSVAQSHAPEAFPTIVETARALKADGAGAILLGCAGMAGHRARLEEAVGVPVIDPVQAATGMALAQALLGGR